MPAVAAEVYANVYPLLTPVDRTLSMMPVPPAQSVPVLSSVKLPETEKPTLGQPEAYVTSAVLIVRSEPTAEDSLAAIRDLSKFGIAIAAMIRMIATTISNSIREKPFCFFM